jgi:hypothetical protein
MCRAHCHTLTAPYAGTATHCQALQALTIALSHTAARTARIVVTPQRLLPNTATHRPTHCRAHYRTLLHTAALPDSHTHCRAHCHTPYTVWTVCRIQSHMPYIVCCISYVVCRMPYALNAVNAVCRKCGMPYALYETYAMLRYVVCGLYHCVLSSIRKY